MKGDTILTIAARGRSGFFTLNRVDNVASYLSQPLLSLTVLTYSDSTSIYRNQIGRLVAFDALDEKKPNTIFAVLDTRYKIQVVMLYLTQTSTTRTANFGSRRNWMLSS